MNVCLVSSRKSGQSRLPVIDELVALGYRVVVLFLHPQDRALWNEGGVVYVAAGLRPGQTPLGIRYKLSLERARAKWLRLIKRLPAGTMARILAGIERRAYSFVSLAGTRVLGKAQAALTQARSTEPESAFEILPQGIQSYAVIHALDAECVESVRLACQRSAAVFVGPDCAHLQSTYEAAIDHWVRN